MKNRFLTFYTSFIAILSLTSVILVILNLSNIINIFSYPYIWIDSIISIIFTIDYIARFLRSKNKKHFVVNNILDLIAILPLNPVFASQELSQFFPLATIAKLCNLAKILRFIRIVNIAEKMRKQTGNFLHTNGFIYVLYITLGFMFFSSIIICNLEQWPFLDCIWFCFVTSATVGYGDMVPLSGAGKFLSIVLMLFGVALLGMLTSTITTYFSNRAKNKQIKLNHELSDLIDVSSKLSDEDLKLLISIANTMSEGNFEISIKS